ncbi:solute carrier family 2, facilitated glucose transporter member 1 isoform X2 [Aedes aegypti]|uniref:Major facilitator superfamily (MFS) profile domain-containing protein n=1 Tax=Aedes aegypti TaxID=7159 RepID=A0A6I8TCE5_AEDAE|nr:solute carrier family 2, facilitated glucose transporter member 1 isoform X2 [Aedes aegypti]
MDFQLPETGWTPNLVLFGFVICFGSAVPLGMQVSVINAPAEQIQQWCRKVLTARFGATLSTEEMEILWASVVTSTLLMGMVGCFCGGILSSKLGRKKSFLISSTLLLFAAPCFLFCRMAWSIELLYLGRLSVGLALGLSLSVIPMYLAEVSPLKLRGAMGVLLPLGITAGVVLGQVVTLDQLLGDKDLWHFGLGIGGLLNFICFVAYWWMPESPEYLCSFKNNPEEALKVIRKLLGQNSVDGALEKQIRTGFGIAQKSKGLSVRDILTDGKYRLPLALLFLMNAGCGLSGINVRIGINSNDAKLFSVGFGCINLAASSCGLFLMDRFNRRPMMLISCIACGVTLLLNTTVIYFINEVSWLPMVSVGAIVLFLLSYQTGVGQIPFFIGAEMFEIEARSSALALGTFGNWLANLIIVMLFPIVQHLWGAFAFLPSSIVCFALAIFVYFYLPETRGRIVSDTALLISKGFKSHIR